MDKAMILVVLVFWLTSTAYVMYWHYKNNEMEFGVVLMALLLGPILVFFIKDSEKEKKYNQITSDLESHHRRWFRTMDEINRQRIPNWGRSIPPPPPLSPPPNRRPNIKTKDFKFFQK